MRAHVHTYRHTYPGIYSLRSTLDEEARSVSWYTSLGHNNEFLQGTRLCATDTKFCSWVTFLVPSTLVRRTPPSLGCIQLCLCICVQLGRGLAVYTVRFAELLAFCAVGCPTLAPLFSQAHNGTACHLLLTWAVCLGRLQRDLNDVDGMAPEFAVRTLRSESISERNSKIPDSVDIMDTS